jgi:hypothetical protein
MLRVAVSIYLMLSMLASQCFCCCTGTRLLLRLTHSKGANESARPSCCCEQSGLDRQEAVKTSQHTSQNPPKSLPCHCRDRKAIASQTVVSNSTARDLQPIGCLTFLAIAVHRDDADTVGASLSSDAPVSFLTARDLLRAFHILRC